MTRRMRLSPGSSAETGAVRGPANPRREAPRSCRPLRQQAAHGHEGCKSLFTPTKSGGLARQQMPPTRRTTDGSASA